MPRRGGGLLLLATEADLVPAAGLLEALGDEAIMLPRCKDWDLFTPSRLGGS